MDGTTKREMIPISGEFSEDTEQSTALQCYEGLSLLLPSPAWKAEVALGVWKWAEGNQVSQCMESLQSHVRNGFSRLTVELFLDKNGCLEWNQ